MPEMRMNSLKSRAMNCGPLSEMTRGFASRYFSLPPCRMISISASIMDCRRSQCTMDRHVAVQYAAQVRGRPRYVDIAHVDMPMLMRLRWLLEPRPFLGRLPIPFLQQPGLPQHPPHTGGT